MPRFRKLPAFLLLSVATLLWSAPLAQDIPENSYGVNVFLHKEVEEWKIDRTLEMIAEANIPWIKQEFPWQEIEFKKGYFYDDKWQKSSWEKFDRIVDLAEKHGLTVVARVDHAPEWAKAKPGGDAPLKSNEDLADVINALLDHYEGRIKYVQVWNEPNLAAEWVPGKAVDPEGYAEMLKEVYSAVKAEHPDAVLLSAPLAITLEGPELRGNMNELDYWQGLYDAGVKGSFDIASANAYGLDQPPDDPPSPDTLNFRRVELLREIMVDNDDGDTPIWFNEYAWNASPETLSEEQKNYWRHVTPEQQAEWTVQGVDYARKNWPWAGVLFIWYFRQVGDIPEDRADYYFAMVYPDFSVQPVYESVKDAASAFPGPSSQEEVTPTAQATTPAEPTTAASPTTGVATPTSAAAASPTAMASRTTAVPAPSVTSTPTTGTAGAGGSNLTLVILGALLVLAGLGGLGYYFMRSRGSGA
jgi:polysaccharide biosynthesis protein PslG